MSKFTSTTVPFPGECPAGIAEFDVWRDAVEAWQHQFTAEILAAAPEWVEDFEYGGVDQYDNDRNPLITVFLSTRNYIPEALGDAQVTQSARFNYATGTLTLADDAPFIDLYLRERSFISEPQRTVNDLDQLAAGFQDLAGRANALGLPSGLDEEPRA